MSLSPEDHRMMIEAGTTLLTVLEPTDHDREDALYPEGAEMDEEHLTISMPEGRKAPTMLLKAGLGRYIMFGTCGNLEEILGVERCSVYDKRPEVCREFEMGGFYCGLLRQRVGLQTEAVLDIRDFLT
jgi:Fe-S-cluster containining protein